MRGRWTSYYGAREVIDGEPYGAVQGVTGWGEEIDVLSEV